MEVSKKIEDFFRVAIKCYGKEIAIPSNQHFSIDQIVDKENDKEGVFNYKIQYGFPQSGCVGLDFTYLEIEDKFSIKSIDVFAPPKEKEMIMANYAPQANIGPVSINVNFGIDMGTQKHSTLSSIEENPNALQMLDIAISDLKDAKIMGNCNDVVSYGSNRIPCCSCVPYKKDKEI